MDLEATIGRARGGDVQAFTELVGRYQDLAFGCAYAVLRDFHLAQDVAQEAFVCAYYDLGGLRDAAAFPAWLRTIVRRQCARLVRRRRAPLVPIEHARDLASTEAGPDERAEERDTSARVLGAVAALPEEQREVVVLFYIREHSQQEIAAFLGLSVTTVNNRLHAARKRLKRRMLPMVKDTLNEHTLPDDFASGVGRIIRVRGPIIDARFAPDKLPPLLGTLSIPGAGGGPGLTVVVAQHLGDGVVRAIPIAAAEGLARGMEVVSTGGPVDQPVSDELLRQAVAALGGAARAAGAPVELLETGIKVIDLLAPCVRGGMVGIFGDIGSGKLVVIEELAFNLARQPADAAVMAFIHAGGGEPARLQADLPQGGGAVAAIYIPADNPSDAGFAGSFAEFDTLIYNSRSIGAAGIWPAIDPLVSTSRALDPAVVGQEHYETALRVRGLLREQEPDATQAGRARRLRRYFSQPFHVAEPFTGRPGVRVPRAATVRDCRAILDGAYDSVPEEDFVWRGALGA